VFESIPSANLSPLAGRALTMIRTIFMISAVPALGLLLFQHCCAASEPRHGPATRIVVMKARQVLELHENGGRSKTYRITLGTRPRGPKRITGDKKTPEGEYFICYKSTASKFHRFLGISYPGITDAQGAFERGMISLDQRDSIIDSIKRAKKPPWNTKLGGWVGIHGYPSNEYLRKWAVLLLPKPHNWTDGCIAMWNFEIEELFSRVRVGTPVTILP